MKARELVQMLLENGWELLRVKGSHHIYSHPTRGQIVLPIHGLNREMKIGLANDILKKAGLK